MAKSREEVAKHEDAERQLKDLAQKVVAMITKWLIVQFDGSPGYKQTERSASRLC